MIWYVVSGVVLIILALYSEIGVRPKPLIPIGGHMGMVVLAFGLAFGAAVFDRFLPKWGSLGWFVVAFVVLLMQSSAQTSALPILLCAGTFQLLRALLRVQWPTE